jgi:hypothetical protein
MKVKNIKSEVSGFEAEAHHAATQAIQSVKATTAKAASAIMSSSHHEITSDLIAARAYDIWEHEGHPQGHDLDNWLLAERQLKQETQHSQRAS